MSMFLSLEPFCIAFANVERFLFFEDADDDILGTTGMGILLLVDRVVLVLVVVVVVVVDVNIQNFPFFIHQVLLLFFFH